MHTYETLKHTTWECKYHVVFIPKYRRKALYVQLRRDLARIFHRGIEQRSGERVRRLEITQPNENTTHRFLDDRL